ncbi:MAG: DUF4430 domain-containing protein [Lachnospiraceae bacterium]|nr:DUF4430 domain-containing protein [Lachnospiraceae bacterium]
MTENTAGTTNNKTKHKKSILLVCLLLAAAAVLALVFHFASAKNVQKGSKECSLTVTDDSGTSKTYECSTDAEYLRELMDELSADQTQEFSYEGSEGQYGLFINTVNGLTADYDKDHAYWAIYVDGEYAQNGADTQPVNDGDKFELKYEVSK